LDLRYVARVKADTSVIALIGSAGALDAVSRILGTLPEDLDASVVVLIHQEPDRVSRLVELLSGRAELPVVAAEHEKDLRPGVVIVAPPGNHLLVAPGPRTALIVSGAAPPSRPSADLLLATLATAVGERATAVVLSGRGHDGATGATAIHEFGGTVVATDEATSDWFSMPQATIERDTVIDHIVRLEDVADLLGSLITSPGG
jgi:two-component system chemotaxis response regulator CheB